MEDFMFEKLNVYQRSLALVEALDAVAESLRGKAPATRLDQLTRAAMSIPLNIAESSGRRRHGERAQYLIVARGSAFECVAFLQVMKRKMLLDSKDYESRYAELQSLTKMLSGLIRHIETKAAGTTRASRVPQAATS